MTTLKNKYKLAIIPQNTLLFRHAPNNGTYDSMYFGFDYYATGGSDFSSGQIQIWKTKAPIISRLIVSGKGTMNNYLTDLEHCYFQFCGEEKYYLAIKHRYNPRLKDFITYLKTNSIDSWVTSAENHSPMELHLFTDRNKDLVQFKQYADPIKNKALLKKNSFKKVILLDLNEY